MDLGLPMAVQGLGFGDFDRMEQPSGKKSSYYLRG
jgi:hypothetical protein